MKGPGLDLLMKNNRISLEHRDSQTMNKSAEPGSELRLVRFSAFFHKVFGAMVIEATKAFNKWKFLQVLCLHSRLVAFRLEMPENQERDLSSPGDSRPWNQV